MRQIIRIVALAFALLLTVRLAYADEPVSMFDSQLTHKQLDTSRWQKDTEQHQDTKGILLFKHKGIRDKEGIVIQPAIGIVYEKVPERISSVEQYAAYARDRTPVPVEAVIKRDDIESIIYFCRYNSGMVHYLVIAHFLFKGTGVQITGDATESVYGEVEDEIQQFIESVRFNDLAFSRLH